MSLLSEHVNLFVLHFDHRTNIEFVVKPRESLFLEGSIRSLPRVTRDDAYPCQMHKQQAFSCLFRHYAKHNGLKKDDLVFYFVDELKPDETPESVHLMPQDEIWVERRKHDVEEDTDKIETGIVFDQFRILLPDGELAGENSDVRFMIAEGNRELLAHKAILSARSEYFRAMFKRSTWEAKDDHIVIRDHAYETFARMIEYIYTNTIRDIESVSANDIMDLLTLANEYVLAELRVFCEQRAARCLNFDNIGKFYLLSHTHNATNLRAACQRYVADNSNALKSHQDFRNEIEANSQLGLLLFDSIQAESDAEGTRGVKKRRRSRSPEREDSVNGISVVQSNAINI